MKRLTQILVIGALVVVLSTLASAQVPQMINYQGKLTTPSGVPVNDTLQMVFSIYSDTGGTNLLWTETQPAVVVEKGVFNVLLGSVDSIPYSVFDGSTRYLGVKVGDDPEITPRKPMVSVAYAFHSATADSASNVPAAGILSVDGVSNPGGDVDLIQQNAIIIIPDDPSNTITIGETHSARTDNPHQTTAAQTGALVSTDGVSNPGGDVDLIQTDAITITPSDPANTIIIGETHSARTDNPHLTTAAQTGALVSVDGVSNEGENVDFIAGSNMTITPDDGSNTITFSAGGADNDWTVDASDGDTTLFTVGAWGIARYGNVLYGNGDSTHVNLGVASTTGTSGQNYKYCTVGGGRSNTASGEFATIGGGLNNTASNNYATIGGGEGSTAGYRATVGGGYVNTAGYEATVGGGFMNTASGNTSTVAGGWYNTASGWSATVGGGDWNKNSGDFSVIPGGYYDTVTFAADYSMIFGNGVYVTDPYRVEFFDGTHSGRLGINRDDRDGGISYPIHVGTSASNGNGAYLTAGGVWTNGSSRTFKENFQPLNSQKLLEKISNLPVEAWNFKNSEERHIGPVAEDFVSAFDVGTVREDGTRDNKYLATEDIAGVALAGVKELIKENQELKEVIEKLSQRIAELEKAR